MAFGRTDNTAARLEMEGRWFSHALSDAPSPPHIQFIHAVAYFRPLVSTLIKIKFIVAVDSFIDRIKQ